MDPANMTIAARHIPKVGLVSLGCPKALVDSERILTQLKLEGYDIVDPGNFDPVLGDGATVQAQGELCRADHVDD